MWIYDVSYDLKNQKGLHLLLQNYSINLRHREYWFQSTEFEFNKWFDEWKKTIFEASGSQDSARQQHISGYDDGLGTQPSAEGRGRNRQQGHGGACLWESFRGQALQLIIGISRNFNGYLLKKQITLASMRSASLILLIYKGIFKSDRTDSDPGPPAIW